MKYLREQDMAEGSNQFEHGCIPVHYHAWVAI